MTCQAPDCTRHATIATAWRTPAMPAAAYWYECDEHAAVTREFFDSQPYVVWSQRPLMSALARADV